MTGRDDDVPIMADGERARASPPGPGPGAGGQRRRLGRRTQIELRIVESGIRRDQGLADAAVLVLQVPELTSGRVRPWSARLFYAYGDALLAADRAEQAVPRSSTRSSPTPTARPTLPSASTSSTASSSTI